MSLTTRVAPGLLRPRSISLSGEGGWGSNPGLFAASRGCAWGRMQVRQLRVYFETLVNGGQVRRERYEAAVRAIEISLRDMLPWWTYFNPRCEAVAAIGDQATELRDLMASEAQSGKALLSTPAAPPTPPPPPPDTLVTVTRVLIWVGAASAVGIAAYFVLPPLLAAARRKSRG